MDYETKQQPDYLTKQLPDYQTKQLQRPGKQHAQDGDDHTQVQEYIAASNPIIQPKDEGQNKIDEHKHDADHGQQTLAVCEEVRCIVNQPG
jgi:hypothetical protein